MNCASKPNPSNFFTLKSLCGAEGCYFNHTSHYCVVCDTWDSDHLAKNCPTGIIVYHGTKMEYALLISKNGWIPSKDGCLGPGVYFTPDKAEAIKIAIARSGKDKPAIL
jgi:hypothetical protein